MKLPTLVFVSVGVISIITTEVTKTSERENCSLAPRSVYRHLTAFSNATFVTPNHNGNLNSNGFDNKKCITAKTANCTGPNEKQVAEYMALISDSLNRAFPNSKHDPQIAKLLHQEKEDHVRWFKQQHLGYCSKTEFDELQSLHDDRQLTADQIKNYVLVAIDAVSDVAMRISLTEHFISFMNKTNVLITKNILHELRDKCLELCKRDKTQAAINVALQKIIRAHFPVAQHEKKDVSSADTKTAASVTSDKEKHIDSIIKQHCDYLATLNREHRNFLFLGEYSKTLSDCFSMDTDDFNNILDYDQDTRIALLNAVLGQNTVDKLRQIEMDIASICSQIAQEPDLR